MPLTILNAAYPLVPVSADTAGGAEQIVAALDREIERAGHRSVVVAARGSVTCGTLVASPEWTGPIDAPVRRWAAAEHRRIIKEALRRFEIDVVHLHGLDFSEYLPPEPVPCVCTLHLPPEWYPREIFQLERRRTIFTCVSSNQRHRCPPSRSPLRTIPPGVDVDAFSPAARRGDYAVMLGRVCPEKGFHVAMDAAEMARVPLILAGQVYPYAAHEKYFRDEIAPRLSRRIRFIGPAGYVEKRRLLASARCVLIPSTVAETSSLVAMEALAGGAPVIAFPSGALPEILEHGTTGYLVKDSAEMAEAIRRASRISPADCRKAASSRFDVRRMARDYLNLYAGIRRRRALEEIASAK